MKFRFIFVLALLLQLVVVPLQSQAAEADPKVAPINYLALGDSLAYGISSDGLPGEGYPDFLAQSLNEDNVLKSSNKGFSYPGYTASDVLKDLKDNVTKPTVGIGQEGQNLTLNKSIAEADLITISVGANDVLGYFKIDPETGTPDIDVPGLGAAIQQVGANYQQILTEIYAIHPKAQVYVMGYYNPFPHMSAELQPQLEQLLGGLNASIQAGLQGTNAVFVPTSEAIAADFSTYLPNPENIHLSEAGYQVVASQFYKQFQEKFQWGTEDPLFSDIEKHWAREFIEQAAAAKIINGHSDGTFKPENKLTRVQAASILVRTLGLESDETAPFPDIKGYDKATQAEIAAAYQFGLVKGSEGKFNPGKPVTRAQLALMVKRSYEFVTGEPYVVTEFAPFPDIASYDTETKTAISMLYTFKIVEGSEGKFLPGNATKRGQAAKIFVNYLNHIEDLPFFIADIE